MGTERDRTLVIDRAESAGLGWHPGDSHVWHLIYRGCRDKSKSVKPQAPDLRNCSCKQEDGAFPSFCKSFLHPIGHICRLLLGLAVGRVSCSKVGRLLAGDGKLEAECKLGELGTLYEEKREKKGMVLSHLIQNIWSENNLKGQIIQRCFYLALKCRAFLAGIYLAKCFAKASFYIPWTQTIWAAGG